MILTTTEAKEKQCCNLVIGYSFGNDTRKCSSDKCMAWRWFKKTECIKPSLNGFPLPTPAEYKDLPREEWTGYCGLAGKP